MRTVEYAAPPGADYDGRTLTLRSKGPAVAPGGDDGAIEPDVYDDLPGLVDGSDDDDSDVETSWTDDKPARDPALSLPVDPIGDSLRNAGIKC